MPAYIHVYVHFMNSGAFYYLLGNMSPRFRSKIQNIQLLLLAKYSSVAEFGIDRILEPIVEDIQKLELVNSCMHMYVHANLVSLLIVCISCVSDSTQAN